ncbi:MAG: GAF domain-containing protein [Anaerolineae bacterium]|nr:GAF domain-containing protein [Anaerolineae bacterium]
MSQHATLPHGKSYIDKVMRRLVPVVSIAITIFALLSIRGVVATARNELRNEHESGLSFVDEQLERDLALHISNSQSLARDPSVIRFINGTSLGVNQATSRAADLIALHSREYIAIRHLDANGNIRIDISNNNGIANSEVHIEGNAPLSSFAESPAFLQAMNSEDVNPVVGDFRLRLSDSGEPTASLILDIFTPIIPNSQSAPIGVVQLEINVDDMLASVRRAQGRIIVEQENRHLILLDNQNRIIADGNDDGTVGNAYILALAAGNSNATVDPLYQDLLIFNNQNTGEYFLQSSNLLSPMTYSAQSITSESGQNVNWRLYLVDNRFTYYTPTFWIVIAIVLMSVVVVVLMLMALRYLLTPLFAPVEEADALLQQIAMQPDQLARPPRSEVSDAAADSALLDSVNRIADKLENLDNELVAQIERRNRDMQVAGLIGREAAAQSDLESLLKRAINLICSELGFYHAQVFLLDGINKYAVLRYSRGEAGRQLIERGHRLAVGSESVVGTVTSEKRSVIVNDTLEVGGEAHSANPLLPDTRAEMGLPLIIGDNVIGVLDIQSRIPYAFQIEDAPTYQLLADQIAVAVYNEQLRQQSNTRIQEIDRLNRQLTRHAWQQVEESLGLEGEYGLASVDGVLSAPISIRGEVIGTLDADLPDGQPFSEGDRTILQAVAERVALAIENARLFAETQVSLSETSTLYQLSRQLNEANTLEDVLQAIIVTVAPDAAGGQVWLFDEDEPSLAPDWVRLNVDLEIVPRSEIVDLVGQRFQLSRYPFMAQLTPDDVVFFEDIARISTIMSGALIQLFVAINARSIVFIPLNMRGEWKGFMTVEFDKIHRFSDGEKRIYNALIGQAGIAIDNRLLLQETENSLERQENLYAASRIVNTAQNLSDLVYAAVATTPDARLDFWLGLSDGDPDIEGWSVQARIIAKSENGKVHETNEIYPMTISDDSPMRRREPEVLTDFESDSDSEDVPPAIANMRQMGLKFMVIFPLFSENTPIAFFYVVAQDEYELSTDDYEAYKSLTGQMSTQIQNRRLLEQTKDALEQTHRLYVATRAISSAHDITAVYDAVAGHLTKPLIQQRIEQDPSEALNISISILLAHPDPDIDTPTLRYEYQWHDDPKRPLPAENGSLIPHAEAPFGTLIHDNDDSMLLYPDIEVDAPSTWAALRNILTQHGATSAAVAPLWSRQRWFGIMILCSNQPDFLDEAYTQYLQAIADQVAIAIENQSLQRETEFERQRLFTILSTLPTGVLVLDSESLKPLQHNERVESLLGQVIKYDEPFSAEVYNIYRTGTNLHYPNADLPIYQAQRGARQVQSDDLAILHPLGQTDLLMTAAPIFNDDDEMFAIVAAFQDISTLRDVENTLQANLSETMLLYQTQQTLAESDTLDDVLNNIIAQLTMQQPTDAYIILNNEESHTLELARYLVQPIENANALYPVLTDNLLNINDVQRSTGLDSDARRNLMDVGARAVMVLPLRSKSRPRPLGWLVIIDNEPEAFTSEQERTMTTIADMASTAVDNRMLVASTQEALQETAALYRATTTISRSHNLMELFSAIETALAGLGADMYAGFLTQEQGLLEMFNRGFGDSVENGMNFSDLMRLPLSQADGMYVADITRTTLGDFERAVLKGQNIQAFAAINLRMKDKHDGRLFVAFKDKHLFTENETNFMNAVVDSASVVIDNQVLLEQVQSTLQETSVLYQASKALLDTNNPKDIIDVIVNYLIEPHINQVFIALLNTADWNAAGASVEVAASWQSGSDIDLLGVTLSPDQFPAWTQLSTDTVSVIHDIYDEAYDLDMMEQTSIESLDSRSLVIIPLQVPGRSIGAIWLGSQDVYRYSARDMRIFQAFAEQTSLTLEAARLLEQTEGRARQLQTSAVISQSVGQILDLDVLLPQVVALIQEQFSYDHVQIFLMDDENDWAILHASTGEAGERLLNVEHKLQRGSASVIGRVTEVGEPSIALDTADANVIHAPNPFLPLTRSEMALPLLVKGEVVGALDVQSNQPNAFTDEDIQVLTTLSAQIAVAIENARLYEDSERSAADMGFLFEVTTAAAAAETLGESLQTVASQMREALNSQAVAIFLPQVYEDFHGNQKTLLEIEALAIESGVTAGNISSIEIGDEENIFGIVGQSLQTQMIQDVAHDERYFPISLNANSAMAVPISSGARLIGLIVVESTRPNAYDNDTETLLLTLSGSLSAVIQNTLLLQQLEETVEQLREVDRLKSQFLASMSHELRTPLNSIIGFSRVMLKGIDGPLTDMQEQDLSTIFNSGNHLLNLINDILDQAKIEANELNLQFSYFDVKPMIEGVKSIAIGMLKEKPLMLTVEIAPNMPQAFGDEFRSRQILLNLVSNAIKFTNEGGVTIRAYTMEGHNGTLVRIDIVDTGIGIEEKDMPILFQQFRQVDNSLTRTVGGTGLGLPISKSLAEMQGGELLVASEMMVGSTFSVTIPCYQGAEEELERLREGKRTYNTGLDDKKSEASAPASGLISKADVEKAKRIKEDHTDDIPSLATDLGEPMGDTQQMKTVRPQRSAMIDANVTQSIPMMNKQRLALLIEDNKDMVNQFRRILQREGFEVQTADFPAYAEAMVSQMRPQVVIMDVNFADGKGWELLKNLKERDDTYDIPIIVTTMSDDSEQIYRLGAHMFIQRPFLPDELLQAVLKAELESQHERILIIDDQPDAIRLLTQLLNDHGDYKVFSAQSGDEGISLVARRRPDLIILDLRMPGKDGFAVLDELRGNPETARIPVLVVTGDLDLNSNEQERLLNVQVLPKSDIGEEDYNKFIDNVRAYLKANNGAG